MHTDQIKDLLHYDPGTGAFTWKVRRGGTAKAGSEAGSVVKAGYRFISVIGQRFYAHRLAFFYETGEWPKGDVDHINGNPLDNRWCNLRDVDRATNIENQRKPHEDSGSGLLGVTSVGARWRAQIQVNQKRKHIGYYATPEEAHEAYLQAKRELHQGCTI